MTPRGEKLSIRSLAVSYPNRGGRLPVLDNINIAVHEGEIVSAIGPSGCGKTTLLDCIAGLANYDRGAIRGGAEVAYMMQNDTLFPWRRVIDNVALPLEIDGMEKNQARKKAGKLLKRFGLNGFEMFYPSGLSGGMRQRVALGRTYLMKGEIILMDEPFSRLDAITKSSLEFWFSGIWQDNRRTVFFVTHDIDEAIFLSDRIYVLSPRPGRVVLEISIKISRPRDQATLTTPQFMAIKKTIMKSLLRPQEF